jgi:2-polyprenyl-3-methyl-5-hydroxy-6-metoxy-1,4-benzoquinol methylase
MQLKRMIMAASLYGRKLDRIKRRHQEVDWFPYPILGNVRALDGLLTGFNRKIFSTIKGGHIADLGAADGDLGLFFSARGFKVDLVDFPSTNYNRMKGVHTLKADLKSEASILEIDLDSRFELARQHYDLVFLLGTLYHLKNPYFMLEHLASHSRYLVLSTRVARTTSTVSMHEEPLAYLLDEQECNDDSTNYWVFSEQGLRRLAVRCGWNILDYTSFGDT